MLYSAAITLRLCKKIGNWLFWLLTELIATTIIDWNLLSQYIYSQLVEWRLESFKKNCHFIFLLRSMTNAHGTGSENIYSTDLLAAQKNYRKCYLCLKKVEVIIYFFKLLEVVPPTLAHQIEWRGHLQFYKWDYGREKSTIIHQMAAFVLVRKHKNDCDVDQFRFKASSTPCKGARTAVKNRIKYKTAACSVSHQKV